MLHVACLIIEITVKVTVFVVIRNIVESIGLIDISVLAIGDLVTSQVVTASWSQ